MTGQEFADLEALEIATLKERLSLIKGEAALRALLIKIISLPRQNVFGAVVIQSGALRRVITGEVLTEAQHTPLPNGIRMYAVSYRQSERGRLITRNVLARDEQEAIVKTRQRLRTNRETCYSIEAVPLANEQGFAHTNKK